MKKIILTLLSSLAFLSAVKADHVIVSGGCSLRKWENYRLENERHDRWWANFIRGGTMRMEEIRKAYGTGNKITWMVYRPSYEMRGREDGQNYVGMIASLAAKHNASLVWYASGSELISALNRMPSRSVTTFDYFGHSNAHCFCLDYGSEILAVSTQWLHEKDLGRIRSGIFANNAYCKSWGCHSGESMSKFWKSSLGLPLEGAMGKTNYSALSQGKMPAVSGGWAR